MMLERMPLGDCTISTDHVSVLDIYATKNARHNLEGRRVLDGETMFDSFSWIVIGSKKLVDNLPKRGIFEGSEHIERTELYGLEGTYFPGCALVKIFKTVYQDTPVTLPEPNHFGDEPQKSTLLKDLQNKRQEHQEMLLEFEPKVALDLTERMRGYLPEEVVKSFQIYTTIPSQ